MVSIAARRAVASSVGVAPRVAFEEGAAGVALVEAAEPAVVALLVSLCTRRFGMLSEFWIEVTCPEFRGVCAGIGLGSDATWIPFFFPNGTTLQDSVIPLAPLVSARTFAPWLLTSKEMPEREIKANAYVENSTEDTWRRGRK